MCPKGNQTLRIHPFILKQVLQAFFPADHLLSARQVGEGLIHQTWQLRTNSGNWLLQRIHTGLFTEPARLMENHRAIAEHLQSAGYPLRIPVAQPTTAGALFHRDQEGYCWRMFPWMEHTHTPGQLPAADQAFEAAKAYGIFLSALASFPADTLYEPIPGFHDTAARYTAFRQAIETDVCRRAAGVQKEIDALLEAAPLVAKVTALQLPRRVVHNDTKAGNILLDVTTNRAVAVIDWDTIMPGIVLSDYGDMVRTFVPDRYEDAPAAGLSLRNEVWSALDEGFLAGAGNLLTTAEYNHLKLGASWIVAEQAVRFLTDYLQGDTYYHIKYPEHNLVRARNQLAVLLRV